MKTNLDEVEVAEIRAKFFCLQSLLSFGSIHLFHPPDVLCKRCRFQGKFARMWMHTVVETFSQKIYRLLQIRFLYSNLLYKLLLHFRWVSWPSFWANRVALMFISLTSSPLNRFGDLWPAPQLLLACVLNLLVADKEYYCGARSPSHDWPFTVDGSRVMAAMIFSLNRSEVDQLLRISLSHDVQAAELRLVREEVFRRREFAAQMVSAWEKTLAAAS